MTYRPFFTQNIILRLSGALLFPGQGIKDLYAVDRGSPLSSDPLYSILANVILNY